MYNKLIRAAKKQYWSNNFIHSVKDAKMTWKHINALLNRTNNKHNFPGYFMEDNHKYSTPSEIAEAFNKYFTGIGPNLASSMLTLTQALYICLI